MRLALHIFKKDVRRLWWGIAVVLALDALVTKGDVGPGADGLPAIMMMIAWFALVALAVLEDPLVGDRQFWITRPPRWKVLLGSKLLFALAVIHLPSLVCGATILAAHGFSPFSWIPQLLVRQLIFAALLTLPAIALAVLFQNFAYVVLAVIAIVGINGFLTTALVASQHYAWRGVQGTGMAILLAALAFTAAAIILLQFSRRCTWRSRNLGIASVLGIAALTVLMTPAVLTRVQAAVNPAHADLAFHQVPRPPVATGNTQRAGSTLIDARIPLSLSGVPDGDGSFFELIKLELLAGGHRYSMGKLGTGDLGPIYLGPDWLIFRIDRHLYPEIQDTNALVRVSAAVALHRNGKAEILPVGPSRFMAGLGRCSNEVIQSGFVQGRSYVPEGIPSFAVLCESPAGFPLSPSANLPGRPPTVLSVDSQGPLSPLVRAHGLIGAFADTAEVTPDDLLGVKVVNFELHDIRLRDYVSISGQ